MWQALWAIAYKEFVQAVRSSQALKRLLTMQAINFLMLAWIDVSLRSAPTVLVDQDQTVESRLLIERIDATHTFAIEYSTTSVEQARQHIKSGRAKVAIVIPPNYEQKRIAGESASVLALVDGSDSASSSQALVALDGVTSRLNLEAQQELVDEAPTITPHSVLLFNPTSSTSSFLLPGLFAISLGLGYSGISMRRIVAERMMGNLERLLMTPMNYTGLILGKLVPYFVIGLLNSIVYLLVIRWLFDVPIRGSLALLLTGATLYIFAVLSLGAFVAAGAKHMGEATALWAVLTFPAMMLSGYIFPLSSVPTWLLPISYALPQTHFIEVMRGVCLRGATASELAPSLVYLVVAPIFFSVAAAMRFSRSVLQ